MQDIFWMNTLEQLSILEKHQAKIKKQEISL